MKSPLLSLLLASALAATAQQTAVVVATYAPPKESTILASTFVDWDSLIAKPTAAGQARQVFDNPTRTLDKLEVHVSTLNPGMESHPVHRHPWEEIILVKEGDFEVSINGVKHHAGPGAMIFFAANDPHNAKNVGTTPATYYVINFVTDLQPSAPSPASSPPPSSTPTPSRRPPLPPARAPSSSARPRSPSSRSRATSPPSTRAKAPRRI